MNEEAFPLFSILSPIRKVGVNVEFSGTNNRLVHK